MSLESQVFVQKLQEMEFFTAVTLGLVPGFTAKNIFGYNDVIAVDVREDVWVGGGTYEFPSDAGEPMWIVSDNAADNQSIFCGVLDANFDQVPVVVQLNGTTPVQLPGGPYTRINSAANASTTNVKFAGTVRVTNAGDTKNFSILLADNQQQSQSIVTVPNGFRGIVTQTRATLNKSGNQDSSAILSFVGRRFGGVFTRSTRFGASKQGTSGPSTPITVGAVASGKTDIKVDALVDAANSDVSSLFTMIFIDESVIT